MAEIDSANCSKPAADASETHQQAQSKKAKPRRKRAAQRNQPGKPYGPQKGTGQF